MLILPLRAPPLDQFQLNSSRFRQGMQPVEAFAEKAFDPPIHDPNAAAQQPDF
jgi:hypothetical protein